MTDEYQSTLDFLYSQLPMFERTGASAYKPGLATVNRLAEAFGNPHRHMGHIIHVGGTNGKGSTAHSLAAIFQSAGYRTGLFTSPHLVDFRERMRVDGAMIERRRVVDFVKRYQQLDLGLAPSFFELTTVMAFNFFAEEKVDVAIIEVGLGGRLDSTNIVTPDLSIITNISLDHTGLLGNTPALVAAEKAGIIKRNVPVVVGWAEGEVRQVFESTAKALNAPIAFACDSRQIESSSAIGNRIIYQTRDFGQITSDLTGDYQRQNAATVLTAVKCLRDKGFRLPDEAIKTAMNNVGRITGLMGRWTFFGTDPLQVCDTGHNPGGWQWLCQQIDRLPGRKHIVIGFVADKDVAEIIGMISRSVANADFYFTAPDNHRRLAPTELQAIAERHGVYGEAFESVAEAYKKALADCSKADSVFVGGSNYVVAELMESIAKQ